MYIVKSSTVCPGCGSVKQPETSCKNCGYKEGK